MLLAHSAGVGRSEQTYEDHIHGVMEKAENNLNEIASYISLERFKQYLSILMPAAEYHDLGKLCVKNQEVLCGQKKAKHLPIDHRDAGVKFLLGDELVRPEATLIYAHHKPGLPDIPEQKVYETPFRYQSAMVDSDSHLQNYLIQHRQATTKLDNYVRSDVQKLSALEHRIMLSCLVDADYSDTVGEELTLSEPRWRERRQKLDEYVKGLSKDNDYIDPERNQLRRFFYQSCCDASTEHKIEYCDSPVGTGKTTAVLAHMLKVAQEKQLRRIFIVLPYTNIISQTVKVLREAIVLEDENPQEIVAEHHHQADFERIEYRHLSSKWEAPIVVTTAVQFFETLAGNQPVRLRKLHQLPGSGIIFDEYHAALPTKLMAPAWQWITELTIQWGCSICMCSATTFEFWKEPVFQKLSTQSVVSLLSTAVSSKLNSSERLRIVLDAWDGTIPHFSGLAKLMNYIISYPGSKIVVLNTVQSAAVFAKRLKDSGYDVLHLSSALTPEDRERTISEIEYRLQRWEKPERNWILVATSCVECGMDFSFHYGFCELRSLSSYIQLSGRIRRNGEPSYADAFLSTFTIVDNAFLENPLFREAKNVFLNMIRDGSLTKLSVTQAMTKAFRNECKINGQLSEKICQDDRRMMFSTIAREFCVIDDDTVTVIASQRLAEKLRSGVDVSHIEFQRGSVRIRSNILKRMNLESNELPILKNHQYDDFLGYMVSLV